VRKKGREREGGEGREKERSGEKILIYLLQLMSSFINYREKTGTRGST